MPNKNKSNPVKEFAETFISSPDYAHTVEEEGLDELSVEPLYAKSIDPEPIIGEKLHPEPLQTKPTGLGKIEFKPLSFESLQDDESK